MISELEFRFRNLYKSDLFVSFLHEEFKDNFIDQNSTTSYICDENRRVIIDSKGDKEYMIKKQIKEKRFSNYKFNYSIEEKIKPFDYSSDSIKRNRIRTRYNLDDGIQLHITKINGVENEVELEYEIHDREAEDKDIENFYILSQKYIDNFEIHYNNLDILLKEFNPKTSKAPKGVLDRNVVSKARDIEKKDFANNNGKGIIEGYSVTIKANGVPLLLFSSGTHIYFVNFNRQTLKYIEEKYYEKFIILGEYLPEINYFSPFDILYTPRMKAIRYHPHHLERLDYAKNILEGFSSENVNFYWKPFYPIGETVKSFARAIKLAKEGDYPFFDDGVIMTPIYAPHNSKTNNKKTSISEVPEILKIKPENEQTFDVRVDISEKKIYAYLQKDDYRGSSKYPLLADQILWNSIPDNSHMKIVELSPSKDENDRWVMKFNRERSDRKNPNSKDVIDSIWNRINEPLDKNLFEAKGVPRLILQNRRVKTEILSKIPEDSIVVDLGTGRGGDIGRYNKAKYVLCVEPDEENRRELIERIRTSNLGKKFYVIGCGAENTNTIIKNLQEILQVAPKNSKVVVSSMLSMTFFWRNRNFINRFKETLRAVARESNGADFYFFTVEGNKFLKYLEERDRKINTETFKAIYDPNDKYGVSLPGRVKIAITGTIVKPQVEYLVNLSDLEDTLEDINVFNGRIEEFLTTHESRMADASVYGYARIK